MRQLFPLALLAIVLTTLDFSSAAAQIADYSDVLLVVNQRSWASQEIGSYFAERRGIPENHIYRIDVDSNETIDSLSFQQLRWQMQDWMRQHDLVDSINYIVTTKGCPLRVSVSVSDDNSTGLFSGLASFEDCLALMNGSDSVKILLVQVNNLTGNRYYNSSAHFRRNPATLPMYLVTRLDAYYVEQVKAYIRAAETPSLLGEGLWELDIAPGRDNPSYRSFNDQMRRAATLLEAKGLNVLLDTTATYLHDQKNVVGYASWGSNDVSSGGGAEAKPGNTWLNGSIAETAVSTGGRTFDTARRSYGQSLVADWLDEGVNGVKGYTNEPYLVAIAEPDILFDRYTSGFNLAESFWAASKLSAWRQVVIGDPKMHLGLLARMPTAAVFFGSVGRYDVARDTIWIGNAWSSNVMVTGTTIQGNDSTSFAAATVAGVSTIAVGDSVGVVVSFHPVAYGVATAQLRLEVRRTPGDSISQVQTVQLTGSGSRPDLDVPDSVFFTPTPAQDIPLMNLSQTDTVTVDSLQLAGTDVGLFEIDAPTTFPVVIPPGQTAMLSVSYSGEPGVGSTARIYVFSNAQGTGRINLSGQMVSDVETPGTSDHSAISISAIRPNPASNTCEVDYRLPRVAHVHIDLVDTRGAVVASMLDATLEAGEHAVALDVSALPSGVYHLRLDVNGRASIRSLVITR